MYAHQNRSNLLTLPPYNKRGLRKTSLLRLSKLVLRKLTNPNKNTLFDQTFWSSLVHDTVPSFLQGERITTCPYRLFTQRENTNEAHSPSADYSEQAKIKWISCRIHRL